jgi:Putative peptidoglycan binding domain
MASNTSEGLSTGTKVFIGIATVALILLFARASPDNDAWDDDASTSADTSDEAKTVDLDLDDDGDGEVPPDDPWTRGAPAGSGDGGDDESEPPVDDPWTRGAPAGSGDTDDGPPPCIGVSGFETEDGSVPLPTDTSDDAFASPDCEIGPGASGNAVWMVQVALTACNGQPVSVDSMNGPATTQAIAAVQARNGLAADGVYGPATREVMAWPTVPGGDADRAAQCIAHPGVE